MSARPWVQSAGGIMRPATDEEIALLDAERDRQNAARLGAGYCVCALGETAQRRDATGTALFWPEISCARCDHGRVRIELVDDRDRAAPGRAWWLELYAVEAPELETLPQGLPVVASTGDWVGVVTFGTWVAAGAAHPDLSAPALIIRDEAGWRAGPQYVVRKWVPDLRTRAVRRWLGWAHVEGLEPELTEAEEPAPRKRHGLREIGTRPDGWYATIETALGLPGRGVVAHGPGGKYVFLGAHHELGDYLVDWDRVRPSLDLS